MGSTKQRKKRAATETELEVVCFKMKHTQKWKEKCSFPYMALTIKQATHFKFLTSYKCQIETEVAQTLENPSKCVVSHYLQLTV